MSRQRGIRYRVVSGLAAVALCVATPPLLIGQSAAAAHAAATVPAAVAPDAGFKEFSARVQAYLRLQKRVESTLPILKTTDVPELIRAHQDALARMLREARPNAKEGDLFTPAACEAFRRASRVALGGPNVAPSLAYMQPGAPDPDMALTVNGVYPDAASITVVSPELLAAFPPLPVELVYRVVGRRLILIDVKSRMVVDIARVILPAASQE